MVRVIGPEIPLNPPNWAAAMLNHKNMRGLDAIYAWTVPGVDARKIEWIMPPSSHMRGAEPFL
jgi:hypothetical protein